MPECVDPTAPIEKCIVCGKDVHTCERATAVDNDYRCPEHPDGIEFSDGWVCSDDCCNIHIDNLYKGGF